MSKLHRGGSATDVPVRALAIARVDGVDREVDPDHAFAVTAAVTASGLLRIVTLDTAAPGSAKVARTKVFQGVDESAAGATQQTWVAVFGDDAGAARITDPDHLIILVGLMESDDSSADKVMKKAFEATRDLAVTLVDAGKTRAEMVSQLLAAFRKGLLQGASVSGLFDSDDDLIGRVQALRIRQTDLDEANAKGTAVKRALSFGNNEDAGKYELHFELTSEGI